MKDIVWVQLDSEEPFHAVYMAVAYDITLPEFETLCGIVSWAWQQDDVEGPPPEKCLFCLEVLENK